MRTRSVFSMICAAFGLISLTGKSQADPLKGVAGQIFDAPSVGATWAYDWGAGSPSIPGVEYVPMSWGYYGGNQVDTINWVANLKAGGAKEVLAFNEPDNSSQSNLSVSSALQGYTYLYAGPLPVISPAGTNDADSWMQSFMSDASTLNVPAVAVHAYQSTASSFLSYIDYIYSLYGKPLWITEFAPTDWTSPTGISATDCINYINIVLPALATRSYVARYSWYCGTQPGTNVLETAALFNPDNSLTAVGRIYKNPNPPSPIPNGTYKIINRNSGLALDVAGSATINQSVVDQSAWTGGSNQLWNFTQLGSGLYKVTNATAGRALEVFNDNIPDGSVVDIFDYYDIDCMTWLVQPTSDGYYCMIGVGGGKALDVYNNSTANGGTVDAWSFNNGANQQWAIVAPDVSPSFTLSASSGSVSVTQGSSVAPTISVQPAAGFASQVTYSVSGLPSGVTASFSPASSATSTTLTLTASAAAATGSANVTVTGTSGSLTSSVNINVTVNPAFALAPSPGSLNVNQGLSASSSIFVTPSTGFSGSVAFSASGLPSGVTASFSPTSSTSSTTLTLTASATAAPGPATVTITGTSGAFVETTTISLSVDGSFSLSATPSSLSVAQQNSGTSTITVTPTGGFSGPVAYTASGLPSGVTATFTPSTSTTSTTLLLAASATATAGPATITITGTSGPVVKTTTIDLTVTGNFAISASPTTVSVLQGATGTTTVTVAPTGGFSGPVTYSASGLPAGVTASFNPASSTDLSVLTFTASDTAATGSTVITITGTSGALSHSTTVSLSVTPGWLLSGFSVSPTAVDGGSTTTATITLSRAAPASGMPVALSVPAASAAYVSFPSTVTVPAGQTVVTVSNIGTHTVPSSKTVTLTATLNASSMSASVTIGFIAGSTQNAGLQFFSEPWSYNDLLANIFVSPLPTAQIANWNSAALAYIHQGGTLASPTSVTITPGLGYWAVFPSGGESLKYLGIPASATVPTTETLNPGWNAIGDPYTTSVSIGNLTFGAAHKSFASSSAIISPTLYYFQQGLSATSGSYITATPGQSLTPGKGYWIYAYSATTLTFPLPASGPTPPVVPVIVSTPPVTTTGTTTGTTNTFTKRHHH